MLIGFTGLAQSGKSTACNYILEKYPTFVKVGFKDAIVEEMRENFAPLLEHMADIYLTTIDDLFTKKPPLMRKLMQCYGTEVRRGDDPEYWINQWKESIKDKTGWLALLDNLGFIPDVLCDDVRFLNEATAISEMGGYLVRIKRPDVTHTGDHQSETEMLELEVDYTIEVEPGNLEGLYTKVDNLLASIKER